MQLLTGGEIADANGTRRGDVAISDGTIVDIGADLVSEYDADDRIDLSGSVVAPGLIDAHVHLAMDGRPDVSTLVGDTPEQMSFRATANLEAAVRAGVTTIRELGAPGTLGVDAAAAVDTGLVDGPRVIACGEAITMTGGHGHWLGREADGASEVTKAAREQLKRGADVIKCIATGGVLTEGAVTGAPELTEEELSAAVKAGQPTNTPVAAHAHGATGIKNAVRAGVTSVEHGTYMDEEAAEMMVANDTYWVPTASALRGIIDHKAEGQIPTSAVQKAESAAEVFADTWEIALDAGVPIAMGTDAGTPYNYFEEIPDELQYMVDYGLSPAEALEAATVNAADLLGLDNLGTIETGNRADLVVLEADPNDTVDAWKDPEMVFVDGTRQR